MPNIRIITTPAVAVGLNRLTPRRRLLIRVEKRTFVGETAGISSQLRARFNDRYNYVHHQKD